MAGVPTHSWASARTQRSLPGPAGRAGPARPAVSTAGCGNGSAGSGEAACGHGDPDFEAQPWVQALQEADTQFDEGREPFKGNTVRAALELQQNAVLERLLAVVLTVRKCHSGEAFVRLKDPTGAIGGTLTRAVLENEPELRQGAVVRLRRVTVLRTPPPRSINHLCITLESVVQVIPLAGSRQAAAAAGLAATQQQRRQQQPQGVFPALPAPPTATTAQPASSWQQQQQPRLALPAPQAQQQRTALGPARSQSFAWPSLGATLTQPSDQQHQQQAAWPPSGSVPGVCQQQHGLQQQQQMPPPRARRPLPQAFAGPQQQQQQQLASPGASDSVGFALPNLPQPRQQQQAAWQGETTSVCNRQETLLASQVHDAAASQQQLQQGRAAAAGAGWLAGLLAEAEFDPFASQQPSQQDRPVLAEPQTVAQQLRPHGQPATKRHCTSQPLGLQQQAAAQKQQQQQQASPPRVASAAVFAEGIDELDLDEA